MVHLERSTFMFNLSLGKLPVIFSETFTKLGNFDRTRNYFLPKVSHKIIQNLPTHTLILNWNGKVSPKLKNIALTKQNPPHKQQINFTTLFQTQLKSNLLAEYSSFIKCKNAYCRDCC